MHPFSFNECRMTEAMSLARPPHPHVARIVGPVQMPSFTPPQSLAPPAAN